jgi:hypothetical protein
MINAEMTRLNPRKIPQRFLKMHLAAGGGLAGSALDDEDDEQIPVIPSTATAKI